MSLDSTIWGRGARKKHKGSLARSNFSAVSLNQSAPAPNGGDAHPRPWSTSVRRVRSAEAPKAEGDGRAAAELHVSVRWQAGLFTGGEPHLTQLAETAAFFAAARCPFSPFLSLGAALVMRNFGAPTTLPATLLCHVLAFSVLQTGIGTQESLEWSISHPLRQVALSTR